MQVGSPISGAINSHDVTGGVYKARERIQGVVADTPLLATKRGFVDLLRLAASRLIVPPIVARVQPWA